MRTFNDKRQATPFGLWLQEYVRCDLSITNLDYVIEDYKNKKIMLLEEKQSCGKLHNAQKLTFKVLDNYLKERCTKYDYEYWGLFILVFPKNATMPGPGMTLNDMAITVEQLKRHLDFEQRFCNSFFN